ncbi:hemicentin-1 [Bicyclus anynana]|uniref:Hemicentin-1 n=1 Tax=Bicyclus anynana TaxID=110368 RepID=A0ABM3LZK9_BICAN|nr:hemicentin-1 [Bicyclus anynana]
MVLAKGLRPTHVAAAILVVRILSVFLVQTWYVPDEYWQTLEVAHKQAFGYGALTWEWRAGIRNYLYPSVIALLYTILKFTGLDYPEVVVLIPRIFQAILSAVADYSFYKWTGGRKWALFLVLTSWFWFYTSGRNLLQTLETVLVTVALSKFPFKGGKLGYYEKEDSCWIWLASVSVFVRPTSLPLWAVLALYNLATTNQDRLKLALKTYVPIILVSSAALIAIDSYFYGRLIVTPWEFYRFNILQDVSSHYGVHPWYWYISQGLPAVLGVNTLPVLWGIVTVLRRPQQNKVGVLLLVTVAFHVIIHSFVPHKEFRFVLPLLPILLYLAQDVLVPWSRKANKWQLYLVALVLLVGNAVPALYFGMVHQSGTVKVMPLLRDAVPNNRSSILFITPCHSTPLYSHLHMNVTTRYLNCDPPLRGESTEQEAFYNNPQRWWRLEHSTRQTPSLVVLFDVLRGRVEELLKGYRLLHDLPHTQFPEGEVGERLLVYQKIEGAARVQQTDDTVQKCSKYKMGANSIVLLLFFLISFTYECKGIESIQPSHKVKSDGKGSLVFVFDTTGSMFNDLRQLREGAEMILKTALEESQVIADFVFVPFHDPGVGPATVTKDIEVFKKALASVGRVYGGGNCPEMTLKGIQLALNVSRPHSFLYVFTDASAYDHKLVGKVLDAIQRQQTQVVFVLTGHCNDLDKPTFRVYHQIATASSGQVFNLNKTSVHKVLDFVRSSIKGRTVNLASAVNPPGYNYTQEIPVDKSVGEVTVSVSGAKPQIRVVSPSGERLIGPPRLITTLDLSEIMIVKVLRPEPGNWSITVGSEEQHSVRVVGLSNLTFQQGFSVQPAMSMDETSYRPLKGTYNHMLISLNGTNTSLHMDQVQLLSMDGKPLFEVPLQEVDKERNIYQAAAFVPPDEFFNIAIIGHDDNGQEIRRMGSTAVQAKPPDVPYLVATEKVEAHAHSQVKLTCHVESLVPVSSGWTKDDVPLQKKTQTLQSTSIEYVIDNMEEGYVGTYQCDASNAAGSSKAVTILDMIVDLPKVTVLPENNTITENDTLTVQCSVLSEALLKRTTIMFNGTLQSYAKDFILEPSIDGHYAFNHTILHVSERDSGVFSCIATNRGGSTNQSSYITVNLKPTVQIQGERTISKEIYTDLEIVCTVENAAKVQWLNINKGIISEQKVNGSYSSVLDIKNVTEDGIWTCLALKDDLKASDTVNLTVSIKPQVKIDGSRNRTLINGTLEELICIVQAKPTPIITWRNENEEVLANVSNPEPNLYKSVLTLDSAKAPVNGSYICIGQNSQGVNNDSISIHVKRKMTLLQGFSDTSVELYSQIDFQCLMDSDPLPNITWYHNNTRLLPKDNINFSDDNTIINIQKVEFDDLGLYVCEADDGYGKITVNGTLSVHGLERPILDKELAKISTLKGKSLIMPCRLLKGNPQPNIKWEYKSIIPSGNFTTLPQNVEIDEDNGINLDKVTKNNAGIYKCTADNIIGSDSYEIELVVRYPPELVASNETHLQLQGPKEITVGETIRLSCNVTGIPPPIVTWTRDGSHIAYSKNVYIDDDEGLVIENATKFESGMYSCNASNALGVVLKNFTVTIYNIPEINTSRTTSEIEVIEGQLVELPCSAQGFPLPQIKWFQNGEVITESRKYIDEYGLRFVANATDFGVYTCDASNDYGSASINYTVMIWVTPHIEPPLEVFEEIQYGANVSIECNAVGFPIPNITWMFGDEVLINSTNLRFNDSGNLSIVNVSVKNEGPYICAAENIAGIAKKTFYVSVRETPAILTDNYTGPYEALNLDTSLIISCKATGNPKPYVAWIKDGFYLDTDSRYEIAVDGTLTIKKPTEELSGVYTCVAKNHVGNATKDFPVKIYSAPVLMQDEALPFVTTAVEGANVTLQCPVRGGDYNVKWYKDAVLLANGSLNLPNVSRTNESTYACVAGNAAGSVHASVALRVEWSPSRLTTSNDSVEVVRGENCYLDCKTDSKPRAKTIWFFNSKRLVLEDREVLKLLTVSPRHVGLYRCVAGNEHGTIEKLFHLRVLEPPFISEFEMLDVQLKAGINATLQCIARGDPEPSISWTFNNTNWVARNASLISSNVSTQSEGSYRCEATNKAGIAHIVYRVLVVSSAKVDGIVMYKDGVGTNVDKNLDLVLNTNVRLACKASGHPTPMIQWIRHGNAVSENTGGFDYADLTFDNLSTTHAGYYSCIVSNEGGIEEKTVKVNILEPPRIFQTLFQNGNTSQKIIDLEVISGQAFYMHCHPYGNPAPEVYWFKDGLPLKLYDDTMITKEFGEVLISKSAKYEQSGNYTCVARNKVGETSVVYLVDVLVPPPLQKDNIKQANALLGTALILTCPAEGRPTPFVMWIKHPYTEICESDRIHLLNDNYTLMIPDPKVSDSGKYSCIMSNKVGTTELVYEVTIEKPPSIMGNVGNDTSEYYVVPLRRSLVLKCEVDGHPQPKITWFKDIQQLSSNLPNIQRVFGNSLVGLWSVNVNDAGQYICVAENSVGTAHRRYNVAVQVPGKWSAWSTWSYCNATCGAGYQQRARTCQYIVDDDQTIDKNSQPDKWILDESSCKGQSKEKRKCNMPPCEEEESRWSSWSQWSRCSVSCGAGTQARTRRCRGEAPCGGDNVQIRKCPGSPRCRDNRRSQQTHEDVTNETDTEYIPEATIEMTSSTLNVLRSAKTEDDFYIPSQVMQPVYRVNATVNLDGSERGRCGAGYRHDAKNDSCEDVDECLVDSNQCHLTQACANAPGGYVCSCPEGYASLGAGQRCLGEC